MALAPYFRRSAVAAAQVLSGYDEQAIAQRLTGTRVGLAVGKGVANSPEGGALTDLAIRLLARLYPTLVLAGTDSDTDALAETARAINPDIQLATGKADVAIGTGATAPAIAERMIGAGSDGWVGRAGTATDLSVGPSTNPFGAAVAACLACANVFRAVFLEGSQAAIDEWAQLCALPLLEQPAALPAFEAGPVDIGEVVLVGTGAVGNAAAWALSRTSIRGRVHLVDHEAVDLGNLQRYLLATPSDVGCAKVGVVAAQMSGGAEVVGHPMDWATFCDTHGRRWDRVLVAVDSARDRRAVQASLPRWIANGWTQPGDLGVSVHPWTSAGACLSCMYLPPAATANDDAVVAAALGLTGRETEVRRLLYSGEPISVALLDEIAGALDLDPEPVRTFAGRPLRELYVEGVCGGALVPLDRPGRPAQDVHVPLAHQSTLAGVLLAAAMVADVLGLASTATTTVTRIDVLRPLASEVTQPAAKDPRGICICQDAVYGRAWAAKWAPDSVATTAR